MIDWKETLLTPAVQALRTGNGEVSRRIERIFLIQRTIAGLMVSIDEDRASIANCEVNASEFDAKANDAEKKVVEVMPPGAPTSFTTVERSNRTQLHLQWSNYVASHRAMANTLRNTADSLRRRIADKELEITNYKAEQERQWASVSRHIPFGAIAEAPPVQSSPSAVPSVPGTPQTIKAAWNTNEVFRLATIHKIPARDLSTLNGFLSKHPTKGEAIAAAIASGRTDSEISEDLAASRI